MVSVQVLKEFQLFKGLDDRELAQIAEICEERPLHEDTRCFTQGTGATELHLCRSGKINIDVWLREPWNKSITVHTAEAGEVFGWSALVAPYTYTASAECIEDGQEIYIKAADLMGLFERNSHTGYVVMRNLGTEISARLAQTRQRLSLEIAIPKANGMGNGKSLAIATL